MPDTAQKELGATGLEALSGAGVSVCAPHYRRGLSHSSGAEDAWQADKSLHGADPREQDSLSAEAWSSHEGGKCGASSR